MTTDEDAKAAPTIGYARVSTDEQDRTAQRDGLAALDVVPTGSLSITAWPGSTCPALGYARRWPRGDPQCGFMRC